MYTTKVYSSTLKSVTAEGHTPLASKGAVAEKLFWSVLLKHYGMSTKYFQLLIQDSHHKSRVTSFTELDIHVLYLYMSCRDNLDLMFETFPDVFGDGAGYCVTRNT